MTGRRGLTLLEVMVALVILAVGVTALQRLLVRSVATVTADGQTTRAMLLARALLAEAEVQAPEPGHSEGMRPGGLHFERDVRRTLHPSLRQVRVRVYPEAGGTACELVEMIRVPTA
ncbi:MAG TPA: prepilin-type N-terminal cleavage/methylation domain-containing protein [Verrucomicrobiae bacterium]|nr:prepilin-type N-terminal cleavage/methylation domain-containing protein [Verrucomicrobiae bacterium]